MAARLPSSRRTCTGCMCAVPSGLTTYTNSPFGPRCTATEGIVTALRSMSTRTRALTNWPGQSVSVALANSAFNRIVPVLASMALSMVSSRPSPSSVRSSEA